MNTLAARLASLPEAERSAVIASLDPADLEALPFVWPLWARPDQLPPPDPWRTWLLLGGRGSGKTRSSSEWIRSEVESGKRAQIGVIGPTSDSLRRVQVEGPSGILSVSPRWFRPIYEPSMRRLVWPNGSVGHLFSAEEPDRLRGPNLDLAWLDELCAWPEAEAAFDMVSMALRIPGPLGHPPQMTISTTPKAGKLLRAILGAPTTITTRAKTSANIANLDASTLAYLNTKYGGTSLGRQELDAELLDAVEGAMWSRALLQSAQAPRPSLERLRRIVVAIDPAGGTGKGSTETGIVVAGVDRAGHGYVLADLSGKYNPEQWARRAVTAYRQHKADRIVAERNFGGDMVEATIRMIDRSVPVRMVTASRGKMLRAEPVVALYEQHRVSHSPGLHELEDQLCQWDPRGNDPSPDRMDALVWGITDLMVEPRGQFRLQKLGY